MDRPMPHAVEVPYPSPPSGAGTVSGRGRERRDTGVRVVAIGASAGGADAIGELLSALPAPMKMAFVVVQHLDPSHGSTLAEMLQRSTTLVVRQAEDGTPVEADHVYVIPPDRELSIRGGVLHLKSRPAKVPHRPIDCFFGSLAREQSSRAIGIVLSGKDADGAEGLQAIHDGGGITFVQDDTAQHDVMPRAAAASADFTLRPSDIAAHLVRIAAGGLDAGDGDDARFDPLLRLIRGRFGVDFSTYKKPSIHRRILRRMLLDGYDSIEDYAIGLPNSEEQLKALHQDLLIGVTAFFREPKQFEAMLGSVLPALLPEERSAPLRIWVAGCSTGEEVYSIAMTVLEYLGDREMPVTVFATDLNESALEFARSATYSDRMLANVSVARREAFFVPAAAGFRVAKKVRDLCVFARHDLTRDPPYSHIDLLTCCNVLIYFGPELQQRALRAMHYALVPDGFLMLGTAETLRTSTLFIADAPKASFYRKIAGQATSFDGVPMQRDPAPRVAPADAPAVALKSDTAADLFLLERRGPAGVLVNAAADIVRLRGNVDPFVRLVPGQANLNLFRLVRHPEVLAELRPAVRRAVEEEAVVTVSDVVVIDGSVKRCISVDVLPFSPHSGPCLYWIVFMVSADLPATASRTADGLDEAASLRRALSVAVAERESLASDAAAAAEEAQSADEELRSANEELETAKEELQSANEELLTLNRELLGRNTSLLKMNDDLQNVMSAVEIPMVLVGIDGNIRRFNGPAAVLFHLDIDSHGRPMSEARQISSDEPDIGRFIAAANAEHSPMDVEVRDRNGRWRLLRIRPYRTNDGTIDGAILAVVDIDTLKRNVLAAEKSARLSTLAAEAGALLASSLDYETTLELVTRLAVPGFADWCSVDLLSDDGSIRHLAVSHANPFMRELAAKFQQLTWDGENETTAPRHANLRESILLAEVNPSELSGGNGEARYAQLVGALGLKSLIRAPLKSRDRTFGTLTFSRSEGTYGEDDLEFANALARQAAMAIDTALLFREAEAANGYLHALLGTVAHEIRTPLTAILGWTGLVEGAGGTEMTAQALAQIDQSARLLKVFVDDLLDTERIKMRKLRIEKEDVDLKTITETAAEMMRKTADMKKVSLLVESGSESMPYVGDHGRLLQVVWNLVSNAVKFTPAGGEVRVVIAADKTQARLTVTDNGIGIDPETIRHVFELFHQGRTAGDRTAGLGLGLAIVKEVVTLHGGTVTATSRGAGAGSTFTVLLPLEARVASRRRGNRRKNVA